MELNTNKNYGTLSISETVIEKIAQLVVSEVDGVAGMSSAPLDGKDLLLRSRRGKSIRLILEDDVAQIDIYVIIKAGYKIKGVAQNIQNLVKDSVQNMTSVTVSKVNVYVRGVEQ